MITTSPSKQKEITSPEIKQAAILVGAGILLQETKDYEMAKIQIQKGIEKIKELLISDSVLNREMLINYVSIPYLILNPSYLILSIVYLRNSYQMSITNKTMRSLNPI